jgi:hypothetical protein
MRPYKILILCIVLVIIVVIPDVIIEALHGLLELFWEFLHTLFEILEVALDFVIEHLFNTSLHNTQIIVFYILLAFGSYGLLHLWRYSLKFCRHCNERWSVAKSLYKTQVNDCWSSLGIITKIQIVSATSLALLAIIFLLFM